MKPVLFISDLHLDASRPEVTALFLEFLASRARDAAALYILGDLFEAWIGDDDTDSHHARVQDNMRALVDGGVPGYFMHGNRDFLVSAQFAARTKFVLLEDPTVIDLFDRPTLLMHGDTLCTDDVNYQKVRRMFRNPEWQREFLAQPLDARRAFADSARAESKAAQAGLAMDIMDVNREAVNAAFMAHDVTRLVHGHTHRPGVHTFLLQGKTRQRIVLGDWYEQGSVLSATPAGLSLTTLPLS
ncbi:MAG TPA: UDP-2,3-diacylglucosamine diphosphatase [Gammaproteobacteria bacterium]